MFTREQQQNNENQINAGYDMLCRDDLPESDEVNNVRVREAMACRQYLDMMGEAESVLCIAMLYENWSDEQIAYAGTKIWFGEYEIRNIDGSWLFENLYQNIQTCLYPTVIEGLKTTVALVKQGVA